jgi:hypothetical protein
VKSVEIYFESEDSASTKSKIRRKKGLRSRACLLPFVHHLSLARTSLSLDTLSHLLIWVPLSKNGYTVSFQNTKPVSHAQRRQCYIFLSLSISEVEEAPSLSLIRFFFCLSTCNLICESLLRIYPVSLKRNCKFQKAAIPSSILCTVRIAVE